MFKVNGGVVKLVFQISLKILQSKSPEQHQLTYNHIVILLPLVFYPNNQPSRHLPAPSYQ